MLYFKINLNHEISESIMNIYNRSSTNTILFASLAKNSGNSLFIRKYDEIHEILVGYFTDANRIRNLRNSSQALIDLAFINQINNHIDESNVRVAPLTAEFKNELILAAKKRLGR
jgi:hypothetical protein